MASFAVGVFVKDSMIPMVVIMTTTTFSSFFDFTDWKKNIKKLLQLLKNKVLETPFMLNCFTSVFRVLSGLIIIRKELSFEK
jgi:hypothetical protein